MAIKELKARISADATRLLQACSKSTAAIKELASTTVGKMAASRRAHRENTAEIERHKTALAALQKQGSATGLGIGKNLKAGYARVSSAVTSTLGLLGIGLSTKMAISGMRQMIRNLDTIAKSAGKLGVTNEYFQKMAFAAERTGTNLDAVRAGFTRVKKLAGEFAAGDVTATKAFEAIGISLEEIQGLNAEQIFDKVAAALNSMTDPLLRDSAAAELLGRNFTELNLYLDEYKKLGDELKDSGGIFSDENFDAAQKFEDHVTNIKKSLAAWSINSGLIIQIAKIAEGLEAISTNLDKKREAAGISGAAAEYDKNEGTFSRRTRKTLNALSFSPLLQLLGKEQFRLGDKLYKRPSEFENSTAAPTETEKAARRKEMAQEKKIAEAANKRKEARNKTAKQDGTDKAEQARINAEQRLADALAAIGLSQFELERQRLRREIREYQQAGVSKEKIAVYYARRMAEIARSEAEQTQATRRREAEMRAADALKAAKAAGESMVRQLEQRTRKLQAKLEKFAFDPASINPDETNRERRSRLKTQRLDESIAEKQARQREGKRVHFTRRERERIEEAQGIMGQIAINNRQAAAIRNKELAPVALPAPAPAPIRQNAPAPRRAPQPAPAPAVPAQPAPVLPIPPEPPRPLPPPQVAPVLPEQPPQVAPVLPEQPPQVAPVAPAPVPTLIAPGLTPAVNTVADQQLTALLAIQNAISAMAKNYYTVRGA